MSSDDLEGLRLLRDRAPDCMHIAAGEYGYELLYFDQMIAAGAVDVLQADATRCCGITGFIKTSALCVSRSIPMLFDGFIAAKNGALHPDLSRPGIGVELKSKDAERYRA